MTPHVVICHDLGTRDPHVEFWTDNGPLNLSYVVLDEDGILAIPPLDTQVHVRVHNSDGAHYRTTVLVPSKPEPSPKQEQAKQDADVRKGTLLLRARAWLRR